MLPTFYATHISHSVYGKWRDEVSLMFDVTLSYYTHTTTTTIPYCVWRADESEGVLYDK